MGDRIPGEREEARGATADREPLDPPYVPGQRPRNAWVAPGSSGVVQDPNGQEQGSSGQPTRRRRLLARIPGLSRLAEQSGWVGDGAERSPAEDPGWHFHEGDEPGAFQGWLYHDADGTMVDADGTQYAVQGGTTTAEPEADRAAERDEPEPEPRREVEPQQHAQPEPEPEPESQPGAPGRSPRRTRAGPEAEAEPQPVKQPTQPDPGRPSSRRSPRRGPTSPGSWSTARRTSAAIPSGRCSSCLRWRGSSRHSSP